MEIPNAWLSLLEVQERSGTPSISSLWNPAKILFPELIPELDKKLQCIAILKCEALGHNNEIKPYYILLYLFLKDGEVVVYYGGKAVEQGYFSRTALGESIPSAYRDFYSKVHSSWGDITGENGRIDWPIEPGSAQMCLDENQLHWVPVFDFFTLNPDIRAGFDLSNVSNGTAASFYIDDFRSGEYTNLPLLDGQATNELAALVEVTLVHGLDAFDTRA